MPLSEDRDKQWEENLRRSHENAVYQAFHRGKGVLPAESNKDMYWGIYGGLICGLAYAYLLSRHIPHELLKVFVGILFFGAGFAVGVFCHGQLFVVDKSWERPRDWIRKELAVTTRSDFPTRKP